MYGVSFDFCAGVPSLGGLAFLWCVIVRYMDTGRYYTPVYDYINAHARAEAEAAAAAAAAAAAMAAAARFFYTSALPLPPLRPCDLRR